MVVRLGDVDLRQRHHLGLVDETTSIGLKLVADRLVVATGVLAVGIDQVQDHATALHMTEKTVAEADALVSTLDQPRNVGQHELGAHPRPPRPSCGCSVVKG